jgi:hypothetical protein
MVRRVGGRGQRLVGDVGLVVGKVICRHPGQLLMRIYLIFDWSGFARLLDHREVVPILYKA